MATPAFEWDDTSIRHLARHEIKPEEAEQVVLNRPVELGSELRNGEERVAQIGETNAGRVLTLISTMAGEKVRVVTAWPADRNYRRYFASMKRNAMLEELKNKSFANEEEEAAWWEANQDGLLKDFKKATAEGRIRIGTVAKRAALPSTTIRLDPDDIAKAREQAAKRGLRYQTYLKMIIHEALLKAGKAERKSNAA